MRPRSYTFGSAWTVAAPLALCWDFLSSPSQRWLDWWPRLRQIEVHRAADLVGSRAVCTWQSPLGYQLRTDLVVTEVRRRSRVTMTASGDVTGSAVVAFAALPGGYATRIDVTWRVLTTRAWMNLLAPVLWPLFWWGHRTVMRSGERGLNEALLAERRGR